MFSCFKWLLLTYVCALTMSSSVSDCFAQRNLKDIPDPDPELERKSFQVADGFEVNLFAADPLMAKPIQMNFDAQGRLWVASSEVYPQIKPGQQANDKVLILEDRDGDGQADKTTVFADGLLIPTGVAPGDGGAYVANSTDLVHLTDTDGDDRADLRRVVLSGFGTEDTHHILHTLRWGPDGMLYMNQSIYIHSHLETPYGVRRMNGGGVWQFRPETNRLEAYMLGLINPWGFDFGRYGETFATDGAGGEGINYVFPGFVGRTSPGARRVMRGLNPGSPKFCGLEVVGGSHLPPEWQGNLITNDFRAHRVCRFVVSPDGSGYASRLEKDLIRSTHPAFRPIDVKMGPDGAIYIADWYNPIIQHGEVDFRDPRRDHVHGRIWRVTAKGRPLVRPPRLDKADVDGLLEALKSTEPWTRTHAKRMLKSKGAKSVLPKLAAWVAGLDVAKEQHQPLLLEALWTYQSLDRVEPDLLERLLVSKNPQVRAAATRVVYHWHDRLSDPLVLLEPLVRDAHPRVRLEAVRALSQVRDPRACEIAMRVLDQPMDEFIDFCTWKTARDLSDLWLPALESGTIDFGGQAAHLTYALKAVESAGVVPLLLKQIQAGIADPRQQENIVRTLVALADARQLGQVLQLVNDRARSEVSRRGLLSELIAGTQSRKLQPEGAVRSLEALVRQEDNPLRALAIHGAGQWKLETLRDPILKIALSEKSDPIVRRSALTALGEFGGREAREALQTVLSSQLSAAEQYAAVRSLASIDVAAAATAAADSLSALSAGDDPQPLVDVFLSRKEGAEKLSQALAEKIVPADVARLALRSVRSSGQPQPELIAALTAAGGLTAGHRKFTPSELTQFLADVRDKGDAARGELVYRRKDQVCTKCHAIGGAGGQVGPDLVSIGASAPVDYLLDSLLEPGKKIKENYHSRIVLTDEGRVHTGVLIRRSGSELILRNAEDALLRIPLDSIEQEKDGGSLMPVGLTDPLTRAELVDLVRFLSELGKVGPYAVNRTRLVRRWQALSDTAENRHILRRRGIVASATQPDALTWVPIYSRVGGSLPLAEVLEVAWRSSETPMRFLRFQLRTSTAGKAQLNFNLSSGTQLWLDGQPVVAKPKVVFDLSQGLHDFILAIERSTSRKDLRIELVDVPGSPSQVQIVGGK